MPILQHSNLLNPSSITESLNISILASADLFFNIIKESYSEILLTLS